MKRIGIVGGIGWQSTAEYYAELCRLSEQRWLQRKAINGPLTPEICIESLDLNTAVALLGHDDDDGSWLRFDEYHRRALQRLQAGHVEVAAIASNTPHHRLANIISGITVPVLSIVDASVQEAAGMGANRVLILGTAMTMRSSMYLEACQQYGINSKSPAKAKARNAVVNLIEELHGGRIVAGEDRIHAIVEEELDGELSAETVVCLACTELPLAFPAAKREVSFTRNGIRYLNTSAAHIHALFNFATI